MTTPFHKVLVLLLLTSLPAVAEDSPEQACNKAAKLYADDDFAGALEEAKWCVTLLEQEQQTRTNSVFPDSLQGFKGSDIQHQSALGFSSTVREYRKDEQHISVTLSGGNGLNSAFAAIAQFGGGGAKMRIQKRSASVIVNGERTQVLVTLKTGGLLMFEGDNVDKESVVEFAKAFPVEKLDDSLQ
ncbi:hypothetical protein [Aliiglaciecola litoralis]|uniref:DUF4252 domain-containing protein n=1 Tax=Aliiglaciecola litoralis TaxID=582857 RepID=A0ABP3WTX6_9ALTE